ncbi:MAG: ABC transporter permease [Acidobacteriia bacterium]|nr:ABC transporter permease [Terriglobia bacterium]
MWPPKVMAMASARPGAPDENSGCGTTQAVITTDPLVPRAAFGVLNTLLFFPSGAIYPIEGFPVWLRWISYVDPFTYAVHALKALLLKNTGFAGIYSDVFILAGFSIVLVSLSVAFFKREI